jgi:hypothetical protein
MVDAKNTNRTQKRRKRDRGMVQRNTQPRNFSNNMFPGFPPVPTTLSSIRHGGARDAP